MARSDLLLALVRAALERDRESAANVVQAIAAEEKQKNHRVLAAQLADELKRASSSYSAQPTAEMGFVTQSSSSSLLMELTPRRRLREMFLDGLVSREVERFIEEQQRADLLRAYGVEPRNTLLLVGPPGNGKTSLAEAVASELTVPFLTLRYDQIFTSYLGETSARLQVAIREASSQHCVLFLDEFDVVGKERADEHDAGEIKRVVSSLLLQLDSLPSHVVVIAATNHSQMLDTAVWRRFQSQVVLDNPTLPQRLRFARSLSVDVGLGLTETQVVRLVDEMGNTSYADLELAILYLRRRQILGGDWSTSSMRREVSEFLTSWDGRPIH